MRFMANILLQLAAALETAQEEGEWSEEWSG
jgi:hypothetical protein